MQLDFKELRELLTVLNQTDITELTLKGADFELTVRKGTDVSLIRTSELTAQGIALASESRAIGAGSSVPPVTPGSPSASQEPISAGATGVPAATPPTPPPQVESKWVAINSPMVGTFYRAPGPDEAPFVEVGDRIRKGQTVCIIEAMKLMNEIEAEVSGQVMEISVQNGQPVEYGQVLMRINPD